MGFAALAGQTFHCDTQAVTSRILNKYPDLALVCCLSFLVPLLQAFESCLILAEARARYEEFCIPICVLPATISNNVPGTDLSIGADTSLNAIVEVREQIFWHRCRRTSLNAYTEGMYSEAFYASWYGGKIPRFPQVGFSMQISLQNPLPMCYMHR